MEKMKKFETDLIENTNNLMNQNKGKRYANLNLEELEFVKCQIGLTSSEKEFLFDIMSYISIGTNLVINKEGNLINQQQIAALLNLDVRSLQRKFKTLINKKIIHSVKDCNNIYYILNPYLLHCGFIIDQAYDLFDYIGYKKESIPTNSVKLNNKPISITKEKILELVVAENLNCVEDGMSLIKTQYEVRNGFIDILAKDKTGTKTIIEIKLKNDDPKLIEQCVYYPTQFNEDIRMISIAPGYSSKIHASLESLGYVEMKTYEVNDNKIVVNNF